MVVDVCTYNGEKDLWDIHYNVLKDHVDEFIVVSFDETFSGEKRDVIFPNRADYPKASFVLNTKNLWSRHEELAKSSPNTVGAEHWKREFMQKESIKDVLTHLKDDDIVFIGDVDEVWDDDLLGYWEDLTTPLKLSLRVYTYWLNNRSSEVFSGTLVSQYKFIKNRCLNHLRSDTVSSGYEYGWHFTSMGGYESVKKKLEDSYTRESYWTEGVENALEANIQQNKDFLGRDFTYTLDESEWPQYLKDNKDKYSHLCK